MTGSIDLLLQTAAGLVVIDHKTFPGSSEQALERSSTYLPQLNAYSRLLHDAGEVVLMQAVHLPVSGLFLTFHR